MYRPIEPCIVSCLWLFILYIEFSLKVNIWIASVMGISLCFLIFLRLEGQACRGASMVARVSIDCTWSAMGELYQ